MKLKKNMIATILIKKNNKDQTFINDKERLYAYNKTKYTEIQNLCTQYSNIFDDLVFNLGFMSIKRMRSCTSKNFKTLQDINSLNSIYESLEETQKMVEKLEKNLY